MSSLSAEEAQAIAKEAYLYGWPLAEHYNTIYEYTLDKKGANYKGTWNELTSIARVYTPADTTVVTPNSDTPYSFVCFDLRAEPIVITVPPITGGRYWSFEMIDMYLHNFAYLGCRTTGSDGGSFVFTGPEGLEEVPPGCREVFKCEVAFPITIVRTQLYTPEDLDNVKAIQAQYKSQTLSSFLGKPAPPAAPAIEWPVALGVPGNRTTKCFEIIDFILSKLAVPTHPSEVDQRDRFLKLGVGSGSFKVDSLEAPVIEAMEKGMAEAWKDYEVVAKDVDSGKLSSGDLFGPREFLCRPDAGVGHDLARFAGAKLGLYGNSAQEAMYPIWKEMGGKPLDASKGSYTLNLSPADMSMAKSFWSVTMYHAKNYLLVENPINRYLVNSPMIPGLKKEPDGSVAIHVSATSPGPDLESNWLPAPSGPFFMVLRLYWPEAPVYEGKWTKPSLVFHA